jgi:hypothetical protein
MAYSAEDRELLRKARAKWSGKEWVEGGSDVTVICRNCGTKFYASNIPAPCVNCGSFASKTFFYVDRIARRVLPDTRSDEATTVFIDIFDEDGKKTRPMEVRAIGRGLNPELMKNVEPQIIE